MYCYRCGTELPENAAFCPRCGTAQRQDQSMGHQAPAGTPPQAQWQPPGAPLPPSAPIYPAAYPPPHPQHSPYPPPPPFPVMMEGPPPPTAGVGIPPPWPGQPAPPPRTGHTSAQRYPTPAFVAAHAPKCTRWCRHTACHCHTPTQNTHRRSLRHSIFAACHWGRRSCHPRLYGRVTGYKWSCRLNDCARIVH